MIFYLVRIIRNLVLWLKELFKDYEGFICEILVSLFCYINKKFFIILMVFLIKIKF